MRRAGDPLCHSISNAPPASISVKALMVRSYVLISPLPRTPTHRHPEAKAMQTVRNTIVIFFMGKMISLVTMQRRLALDSRKFKKGDLQVAQRRTRDRRSLIHFTIFSFAVSTKT